MLHFSATFAKGQILLEHLSWSPAFKDEAWHKNLGGLDQSEIFSDTAQTFWRVK